MNKICASEPVRVAPKLFSAHTTFCFSIHYDCLISVFGLTYFSSRLLYQGFLFFFATIL